MNIAAPETKVAHAKLLVSVRNADEAATAIAGGADWIDLKEPLAGALGAVDFSTAVEVAERIGSRRPLSAALGELQTWRSTPAPRLLDVPEISYVKLGLAGCCSDGSWQSAWKNTDAELSIAGKSLVAVSYADWQSADAPPPQAVISMAAESTARCLLVDTFDKHKGGSLECLGAETLLEYIQLARSHKLKLVLAGKLQAASIPRLPLELIDLVAVRGAACPAGRDSSVARNLVAELKSALSQ